MLKARAKSLPDVQKNFRKVLDNVARIGYNIGVPDEEGRQEAMMKEALEALKNNDGLTLKGYKAIMYKSGYQVADYGVECKTIAEVLKAIDSMQGDCGVWYSEGVYYIDHSFRVNTKKQALEVGRKHNQISVLKWKTMQLIYC